VTLPDLVEPVQFPDDVSLGVEGIVPWETPNEDFYRIDTQIGVPRLSRDGWTLTVRGQVGQERTYTIDQLLEEFEVIERAITLTCVSNEVGGDLVGNARWLGVRVSDVLEASGVEDGATQVVGRAFDGFTTGYPVERAFDRDAMLAVAMNGEPLPPEHGYPLRMVVPGLYGYVSATKWLQEIELTTFEAFDQYWVERDWDQTAPIKISSRIDTPGGLSTVQGTTMVGGVAWAQPVGVDKVEVQIDDGEWQEARLGAGFNDVTWRQWTYEWDTSQVESGRHTITVRATDSNGNLQIQERQEPFPNGATGWQSLVVQVA
jgi:DMSO/TMAO reductase YedYZ molybdopterin-dependent catalytic subunit